MLHDQPFQRAHRSALREVPIEDRGRLLQALGETDADDALSRLAVSALYDSELHAQRGWIDDCYSAERIEDILDRLLAGDNAAARSAADRITDCRRRP